MKGSFYGLRGKQLSLVLLALVCTTIFVLAWEKNPLLTAIRPSQSKLLPVYTEIRADVGSSVAREPPISNSKDKFAISKTIDGEKGSLNFSQDDSSKSSIEMVTVVKNTTASLSAKDKESDAKEEETKEPINSRRTKEDENLSGNKEHGNSSDTEIVSSATELKREHPEDSGGKKSEKEEAIDSRSQSVATGFNSSKEDRDDKQQSLLERDDEQQSSSKKTEACNYAKGKWIVDDKHPLYSGFGCKQWLSAMWACRLTQRMNFDYERLQWQPKDCQMEDFEGSKFLKRMQHKTLAFIGDSLGRQQFQSLMCMITGGLDRPDVENVGKEYGLVKPKGAIRPDGWVYRFPSTNTTILYYWSASLCDLEPLNVSDPATYYAMHLDRPPSFLRWNIHKFDVLVLNTGHHWNRGKINGNRWIMHVGGKPNTNKKIADIWHAKNFTVHSIVKWVDDQLPKYPSLKAFFRTLSPRHFVNGDWNTGGSCNNEVPSSVGKELLQEKSSDHDAAHAVKGTKVTLLDITALSQLRDEGHISRFSIKGTTGMQDCLHWCLPGVPDTWNEILFAQI